MDKTLVYTLVNGNI